LFSIKFAEKPGEATKHREDAERVARLQKLKKKHSSLKELRKIDKQ